MLYVLLLSDIFNLNFIPAIKKQWSLNKYVFKCSTLITNSHIQTIFENYTQKSHICTHSKFLINLFYQHEKYIYLFFINCPDCTDYLRSSILEKEEKAGARSGSEKGGAEKEGN